jgi:hypothetical protein
MLTVALFFFACEDEANQLGYKNPNSKFKVLYAEIPLSSSVLLLDSVRTSNYTFGKEVNSFLVGQYNDDQFGSVTAQAYGQYFVDPVNYKLPAEASFDSVSMDFAFNLYYYGTSTASSQSITVYELDQDIPYSNALHYFNKTDVAVKPSPIGSKTFSVDPAVFTKIFNSGKDSVVRVHIPLANDLGNRIFETAKRFRDGVDSVFVKNDFFNEFKGISVKSESGDKIVGFRTSTSSKITLHYHTPQTDSLEMYLYFTSLGGYNKITPQWGASELSGLAQTYTDFYPASGNRYIQNGTGVVTKIDFSKFLEFTDTIPNMILNSAQLVIDNVVESTFDPPTSFSLRALKPNNRQKVYLSDNAQDNADLTSYRGLLQFDYYQYNRSTGAEHNAVVDSDSVMFVSNDSGSGSVVGYNKDKKQYSGLLTLFMQQLYLKSEGKTRFTQFALYPVSPVYAKSVNRVIFPASGIKLRIYYTKPTLSDNH